LLRQRQCERGVQTRDLDAIHALHPLSARRTDRGLECVALLREDETGCQPCKRRSTTACGGSSIVTGAALHKRLTPGTGGLRQRPRCISSVWSRQGRCFATRPPLRPLRHPWGALRDFCHPGVRFLQRFVEWRSLARDCVRPFSEGPGCAGNHGRSQASQKYRGSGPKPKPLQCTTTTEGGRSSIAESPRPRSLGRSGGCG